MGTSSLRDYDALVQDHRVHRTIYTDPQIFDEELVKVFGGTWTFLLHETEIPHPNDYRTGFLGHRPIIVTRDGDGGIHAVMNRCMHRGVEVCPAGSGSARTFTCSYHGWTYDNTGELVSIPFPRGHGEQFNPCHELNLLRVPRLATYRGFVWGTFDPDAPELEQFLGGAKDLLDQWIDRAPNGDIKVMPVPRRIVFGANWKIWWDAAADGLHAGFVHRSLLEMTANRHGKGKSLSHFSRDPNQTDMYNQDLPYGHQFLDQRPALEPRLADHVRPMPGDEAMVSAVATATDADTADAMRDLYPGTGMNLSIFPNLGIVGNQIGVIRPLAYNRTELSWYTTSFDGVPDEVNTLRLRVAEDFPNFGDPDDVENWEAVQRGLELVPEAEWYDASRGIGLDHAREDDGVVRVPVTDELPQRATQREWKRLMARSITSWARPT